jgi:hypothetical protein
MNRFCKALKALFGEPEVVISQNFGFEPELEVPKPPAPVKEVRVIEREILLGDPKKATLYMASVDTGERRTGSEYIGYRTSCTYSRAVMKQVFYTTCEQAHAAHPGSEVTAVELWRIGDKYITDLKVKEVTVEPKPKVAKGKR